MRRYVLRILIGIDQLGNTLLGGDPDETISSRLGRAKLAHGGTIPWRVWFGTARVLDAVLDALDPHHSVDAVEPRFKR